MTHKHPILYSFRRCPYAMRARYSLVQANIQVELREVALKNKPQAMLDISPKGTVPVLFFPNGDIIEESLQIIEYALGQTSDDDMKWVKLNDDNFTTYLRHYKYFERYPEHPQSQYRKQVQECLLDKLELTLQQSPMIMGQETSHADIALMPFIRQCMMVDERWFISNYSHTYHWLQGFLANDIFTTTMQKHNPWVDGNAPTMLL